MKQVKRSLLLTLALLLLFLCACSGKGALKGRWVCTEGTAPWGMPDEVEFFSDGTCEVDGLNGAYAVDGGRLKIAAFLSTFTYDFSVSGSKLTLKDGGSTAVYEKNGVRAAQKPDRTEPAAQPKEDEKPAAPAEETPKEPELTEAEQLGYTVAVENGAVTILDFDRDRYKTLDRIEVPETLDGLPVKTVSRYAFSSQDMNGKYAFIPESAQFDYSEEEYEYLTLGGGGAVLTKYLGKSAYVTIPPSLGGEPVVQIGKSAFSGKHIVYLHIPDTVTHIREYAFNDSGQFQYLHLPESLEYIGEGAFHMCNWKLDEIVIPDGTKELFFDSFSGYNTDDPDPLVRVPASVQTIHLDKEGWTYDDVFKYLDVYTPFGSALDDLSWSDTYSFNFFWYFGQEYPDIANVTDENFYYKEFSDCMMVLQYVGEDSTAVIPDTVNGKPVVGIAPNAFVQKDHAVKELVLPSTLKALDTHSLAGTDLTEIVVPGSVSKMQCEASDDIGFDHGSLSTIVFQEGITQIGMKEYKVSAGGGRYSWRNHIKLGENVTAVYLPASATQINFDYENMPYTTFYVKAGSYAETYAKERNLSYQIVDAMPSLRGEAQHSVTELSNQTSTQIQNGGAAQSVQAPPAEAEKIEFKGNVEAVVSDIREIYNAAVTAMSGGALKENLLRQGVTGYYAGDVLRCAVVNKGVDGINYSRWYYYDGGELVFAYYEAEDAHRFYFSGERLIRWRYAEKATDASEAVNYDLSDTDAYRNWEKMLLEESRTLQTNAASGVSTGVSAKAVKKVTATSALSEFGMTHSPSHVTDGKLDTAWIEDASGQGIGESITLTLDGVYEIKGFVLSGGYQKSQEYYAVNSRPKEITVRGANDFSEAFLLEDVCGTQVVLFSKPVSTDRLTIVIDSVYEGSKFEDACISEITLF